MKITVIGGGSTYTPELVDGFIRRSETLSLEALWLMDIAPERLQVVGDFARRMVKAAGAPFAVHTTQERAAALEGASFVVTQIRVGGMQARQGDEHLGMRHGLVGQETTGVSGMAKALRTIPVMLDIARDIARLAPGAFLVNFANPSGLVTEALLRHSPVQAIGLCNVPWNARVQIAQWLGAPPERVALDYVGLNHLSWIRGVEVDGVDQTERMLSAYLDALEREGWHSAAPQVVRSLRAWPNYYLRYYYHTGRVLEEQREQKQTRAEQVMEVEKELIALYSDPTLDTKPEALEKRGGAYYSEAAAALIADIHNDAGTVHVVNARNAGAIPNLPGDVVVEVPCKIGRSGAAPLPTKPMPAAMWGLTCAVKAYELLTVEAAVRGDRDAARLALLTHPLGPDGDHVDAVLDDLLESNRLYLPQFFPEA